MAEFDVNKVRQDFPILSREVHGKPLVYLDSAASAQRPQAVIDATSNFYSQHNANVHRGVHRLSEEATEGFEGARESMRRFVGARSTREIIFTRGCTDAINLVAQAYARPKIKPGDEIVVTYLEHHSNIVPWQLLCEQTGAVLKVAPINDRGELLIDEFESLLSDRTVIVAAIHVSNALGTLNPIKTMAAMAHSRGIPILVDGAQSTPHLPIDVVDLDVDFFCVAGHKMYGPTGIGILYGKEELLDAMPPYQGGGEMIRHVSFSGTTFNELPSKFEAGTPNIAGAVGLGAAAEYIESLGREAIEAYESGLLVEATEILENVEGLRIIGTAREKAAVISFVMDGAHPHDIGTIIDHAGIAIRTGHHCAMPLMEFFGVPATARISLGVYNTRAEIEYAAEQLGRVRAMLV